MLESLLARFAERHRPALSRLLTLVARGEQTDAIRAAVERRTGKARVVAVTGNSGVGKSTLVGRLLEHVRNKGRTVAVLACDPESSITGGALLGDRARMPGRPDDDGLLIRSLAVESGGQAIARRLELMLDLLEAFDFEVILVETVGAGQGDTAVRDLADVVVLLVQPESGDELQWEKAGILEIADLVVVHKADLPGADRTAAQLTQLLNLPGCRTTPVLRASASKSEGIAELWEAVEACSARSTSGGRDAQSLLRLVQHRVAERFQERPGLIATVVDQWQRCELDDMKAADAALAELCEPGTMSRR